MIIVADTTPLITLLKIEHLDILESLFGNIFIPTAVFCELTSNPQFQSEADEIINSDFIQVKHVFDQEKVQTIREQNGLDLGESEAIALTQELNADLLLMDEAKGRDAAKKIGKVAGTIGILIAAYKKQFLSQKEIQDVLEKLRNSTRYISEKYLELLENAIEISVINDLDQENSRNTYGLD